MGDRAAPRLAGFGREDAEVAIRRQGTCSTRGRFDSVFFCVLFGFFFLDEICRPVYFQKGLQAGASFFSLLFILDNDFKF